MFCHVEIRHAYVMEIRDLRSFVAVVRCGSFTTAASELGYTQSAVSQQVAALEVELGHRLLQRRPVRPTPVGERLFEHAARILLRIDVARSEIAQLDQEPSKVVVAVCPLAAPWLLASALRELRFTSPSLLVTVRSIDPGSAVAEVASGAVDLALVDGITGPNEPLGVADAGLLSSVALIESPLVVALPADHPLHNRSEIDLSVLTDAPWIVAPGLSATGGTQALPLASPPRPPLWCTRGTTSRHCSRSVSAGHGAALLPEPACARADGIASIPLRSPELVHRTELLTLRQAALVALTGLWTAKVTIPARSHDCQRAQSVAVAQPRRCPPARSSTSSKPSRRHPTSTSWSLTAAVSTVMPTHQVPQYRSVRCRGPDVAQVPAEVEARVHPTRRRKAPRGLEWALAKPGNQLRRPSSRATSRSEFGLLSSQAMAKIVEPSAIGQSRTRPWAWAWRDKVPDGPFRRGGLGLMVC